MAHQFPASIEWGCVRDIISLVRQGDLTADQKLDIGQHAAWFWGSSLEWYRQHDDDADPGARGVLRLILRQLLGVPIFGADDHFLDRTTESLCDECEDVLPGDQYGQNEAVPIIQILGIVVPIIIEILKRMDILDES